MLAGKVFNTETQEYLLVNVNKTTTILERMRGLLFRPMLESNEALWIEPCPSIHTFGMKYPIDVVFLDKNGLVLKIADNIQPMRIVMCKNATVSLELLAGDIEKSKIYPGMKLMWKTKENN